MWNINFYIWHTVIRGIANNDGKERSEENPERWHYIASKAKFRAQKYQYGTWKQAKSLWTQQHSSTRRLRYDIRGWGRLLLQSVESRAQRKWGGGGSEADLPLAAQQAPQKLLGLRDQILVLCLPPQHRSSPQSFPGTWSSSFPSISSINFYFVVFLIFNFFSIYPFH